MSDAAVAQPLAAELELDTTTEGKAYIIKDFSYGNSKVVLLGKMVTSKSGEQYEKRFFATEHFFKDSADKWDSNNYYDAQQLDELIMAAADARRAYHNKTLKAS